MVVKPSRQVLILWFLAWDVALTMVAWVTAYFIRFHTGWLEVTKNTPSWSDCLVHLPVLAVLGPIAYYLAGMYDVNRLRRHREELASVAKGTGLLMLLVLAAIFYQQDPYESRLTMGLFLAACFVLVWATRRIWWQLIRSLRRRGVNAKPALIVGTGRIARKMARALRHASWTGMTAVGHVEDQPSRWTSDLHILGGISDLPRLVEEHRVDHVFIALPLNRFHEARRVFDVLSASYCDVRLVLDVPSMAAVSITTTNLDGLTVMGLRENPYHGINVAVKRAMDVVLSLIALVLLAPVMLTVALFVKLTSPGPVLFRQERCGLNGERFQMLKFRTMRVDAEAQTGPVWARADDPRRTPIGSFLRKTSLDELPQLLNVLAGHMSLVGPRPERPVFIEKFRKTVPNYMVRHAMKAGITGWAQVNGWRGNTSLRKRIQHDLYYITHWNPWFDIKIMWLTIWHGIVNKNAY
ncbi:MAG TPA: undecaprenyl-phosphate glucose phosphotransferase [Gemmatales bacterium]|nr:undecaprenyl-phosphate glucose phosphotransferase [Gemmatales bacterium]HMP58718.1 undecaprenyl-phosphate glucose phosphotransferase [Gemmatales bacterium]